MVIKQNNFKELNISAGVFGDGASQKEQDKITFSPLQ